MEEGTGVLIRKLLNIILLISRLKVKTSVCVCVCVCVD